MYRFASYKSHKKFLIYLVTCIFLILSLTSDLIIYADTDIQAPTAPSSLVSTSHTDTTASLSWTASTDNIGVAAYDIFASGYQAQGNNLINNGGFELDQSGWTVGQGSGNTGLLSIDSSEKYSGAKSAKVTVTQLGTSSENWRVQLRQVGTSITAGKQYIVKFKAKSNISGSIEVSFERYISPYDNLGNLDMNTLAIDTQWKSYQGILTATTTESTNTKFAIYLGGVLRTVWIDDVEIYEASALNSSVVATTTGTSITVAGLAPNSVYNFSVKARDAANNTSGSSNTVKVSLDSGSVGSTSDIQAPTVPGNVTCTSKTAVSATLSWNASTDNVGVTGYDIYNGTNLAGSTTSTFIIINGLSPNTSYSFTIKARDAAGNISASSAIVSVTTSASTDTQAPTAPGNVTCTTKTAISATLSWNASTDNIGVVGYDVFSGTSAIGSSTSTSITITGLYPNTAYSFTVKARDAAGNISAASTPVNVTTSGITDTQAPSVPGNVTCTTKSAFSMTLSWDASTDNVGVVGYDVYNGTNIAGSTTSTSITINGLSPNTSYSFTIKARDAAGNVSVPSAIVNITTLIEYNNLIILCQNGNTFVVIVSASNVTNFNGKTLNLVYNPNFLELVDICAFTYNNSNNFTPGVIPDTDLSILPTSTIGLINLSINKTIPANKTWAGVINSFKFKSKFNGMTTINYSLQ